jgi:cytochrome c oxidase subunit 2
MSRQMIASNVVANSKENLLRWVANPDTIKPGCRMPSMHLTEEQTRSVVDYLLTLH